MFFLAVPVANWSALIGNTTTTSIRISWQNLTPVLGRRIRYYFVVIKSSNGSILNGNIRSENAFSDVFYGLSPYREYRFNVIGVDEEGRAYNGSELVTWTEEGGKYTHINNNHYLVIINQPTHPPNYTAMIWNWNNIRRIHKESSEHKSTNISLQNANKNDFRQVGIFYLCTSRISQQIP